MVDFLYIVHVGEYTSSSHGWYGFEAARFFKNKKGNVFFTSQTVIPFGK